MEKLRSYIAPTSALRPEYARLTQSATDEHGTCPHCGHVQNEAPQALQRSITRSWLALWTIATVLVGVLIVFILLLAKQYTFHCSLVNESSCPTCPGLPSDQAFSESAFTSGRQKARTDMTDKSQFPYAESSGRWSKGSWMQIRWMVSTGERLATKQMRQRGRRGTISTTVSDCPHSVPS